jgi:sugar-specific transcriptional regulator TrmB
MEPDLFKEIGFTEREVKVYLALIELGTSTVGPISKKTKLQPSKVYETIERLKEKGLVSFIVISKTKHFQASDPKEILNLLDEKKRRFTSIVAELRKKQRFVGSKQIAVVHEGYKGFQAVLNRIADTLKKGDYYYAFAFKGEYTNPVFSNLFRTFHEKLVAKGVDDRLIGHVKFKKPILKTFEGNKGFKIRFTGELWPTVVIMFKDEVVHLLWGERPTAIEITSEQIHAHYRDFFLQIWKSAKP